MAWNEKYRPSNLRELNLPSHIVRIMENFVKTKNIPHILAFGPAGVGKSSTIHAYINMVYPPEIRREMITEVNASDDRSIDMIRNIDDEMKTAVLNNSGLKKIVILDEVDNLTHAAQHNMKKTIEDNSKYVSYILICNEISSIISAIMSRCVPIKFPSVDRNFIKQKLNSICKNEGIECSDAAIACIIRAVSGDLRQGITILQTVAELKKCKKIIADDIRECIGLVRLSDADGLFDEILENDLEYCYNTCIKKINEKSISCRMFLDIVFERLIDSCKNLYDMCKEAREIESDINESDIQLMAIICFLKKHTK